MWTTKFCNAFDAVLKECEKEGRTCINDIDTDKIDALIKHESEREELTADEIQKLHVISDFIKMYKGQNKIDNSQSA